jgi:hypothetical protein
MQGDFHIDGLCREESRVGALLHALQVHEAHVAVHHGNHILAHSVGDCQAPTNNFGHISAHTMMIVEANAVRHSPGRRLSDVMQ